MNMPIPRPLLVLTLLPCLAWAENAAEPSPAIPEASHEEFLNHRRPLSITLTSGERLFGQVSSQGEGRLLVHSARAGKVSVDWTDVAQISGKDPRTLSNDDLTKVRGRNSKPDTGAETIDAPIGEKDKDEDAHLLFLRQSSVLLKPGHFDVELNAVYRRNEKVRYVPGLQEDGSFASREAIRRELETRLALRAAIMNRVEAFISVPFLYTSEEELVETGQVVDKDDVGIGDIIFGLKTQVLQERQDRPEVIFAVTGIAPTGADLFAGDRDAITLGGGCWAVAAGVTLIKSFDPVVLFAGVDYIHRFPKTSFDREIAPGHEIAYGFGLGFAVNDAITLSSQIQGAYLGDTEVDGRISEGSSAEPLSVRMGLTWSFGSRRYMESFFTFGLSNDAPDSVMGASVTQRF